MLKSWIYVSSDPFFSQSLRSQLLTVPDVWLRPTVNILYHGTTLNHYYFLNFVCAAFSTGISGFACFEKPWGAAEMSVWFAVYSQTSPCILIPQGLPSRTTLCVHLSDFRTQKCLNPGHFFSQSLRSQLVTPADRLVCGLLSNHIWYPGTSLAHDYFLKCVGAAFLNGAQHCLNPRSSDPFFSQCLRSQSELSSNCTLASRCTSAYQVATTGRALNWGFICTRMSLPLLALRPAF
jgi:hypothetical protein